MNAKIHVAITEILKDLMLEPNIGTLQVPCAELPWL